jgi:hypothetical protein
MIVVLQIIGGPDWAASRPAAIARRRVVSSGGNSVIALNSVERSVAGAASVGPLGWLGAWKVEGGGWRLEV